MTMPRSRSEEVCWPFGGEGDGGSSPGVVMIGPRRVKVKR